MEERKLVVFLRERKRGAGHRLTDLTNSLTGHFTFGYDVLSRRTSLNRPNAVNTTYAYDGLSHLLSVLHKNGSTVLDGATYTGVYPECSRRNYAGNRLTKANTLNSVTEGYTYDPLYQLTQVVATPQNGRSTTTKSYSYDFVGNRLSSVGVPLQRDLSRAQRYVRCLAIMEKAHYD